jgi:hypothetical protein
MVYVNQGNFPPRFKILVQLGKKLGFSAFAAKAEFSEQNLAGYPPT